MGLGLLWHICQKLLDLGPGTQPSGFIFGNYESSVWQFSKSHDLPIVSSRHYSSEWHIKSEQRNVLELAFLLPPVTSYIPSSVMKSTTPSNSTIVPMRGAIFAALAMAWAWGVIAGGVGELQKRLSVGLHLIYDIYHQVSMH